MTHTHAGSALNSNIRSKMLPPYSPTLTRLKSNGL